jgi:hypothetical protein
MLEILKRLCTLRYKQMGYTVVAETSRREISREQATAVTEKVVKLEKKRMEYTQIRSLCQRSGTKEPSASLGILEEHILALDK